MKNKISNFFFAAVCAALLSTAGFAQQTAAEYLKLGNTQLDQKKYKEAEESYSACIRLLPKDPSCYFNRGIARFIGIGFGVALEDLNVVVGLEPNNAKAFRLRAQVYEGMNNEAAALADYNQAIRLKPDYAEAFNNRAYLYSKKGELDPAIADYTQAVKFNPNFAQAFAFRAGLFQKKGRLDDAVADYTRALQIKPDYAYAFYYRGRTYREQGKTELSDADFARAVALNPEYKVQVNATKTLEILRKVRDPLATNPAGSSPTRTPAETEAYKFYESGASHLFGKRYDAAIADLNKSIELNSKDQNVFAFRGDAYFKKGDFDKALADYKKVIAMKPETDREFYIALYRTTETYLAKGDHNSALVEANRALKSNPTRDYGYYLRGKVYLSAGKTELAKADFKKALEIRPDYKQAREELAKLGVQP